MVDPKTDEGKDMITLTTNKRRIVTCAACDARSYPDGDGPETYPHDRFFELSISRGGGSLRQVSALCPTCTATLKTAVNVS